MTSNFGCFAFLSFASHSGVARGGKGGGSHWVSPFWGDTILSCETITPPICGKYLFSSLCLVVPILIWTKNPPIFRQKPVFFLVFTYFWTENPLILQRKPFFFWSSPIFGTKKGATTKSRPGCHHF